MPTDGSVPDLHEPDDLNEPDDLADRAERWPVRSSQTLARGAVATFVQDVVTLPDGSVEFARQFITHPGAVGIIAIDEDDRVAVVRQYRHPVGLTLVEPPAGLLDFPGEDPLQAAQRELAEECQLAASDWSVLIDIASSPGGSEETARVYLATGLRPAAHPDGFVPSDEESEMVQGWVPFGDLVDGVLAGRLQSPLLVSGIMALGVLRATDRPARPADAPWPVRDVHASLDRDRSYRA